MIDNKNCIVLFGLAGSGKGTQGNLIADTFSMVHLSAGELIRRKIESGYLGQEVLEKINKGELMNPLVIVDIIRKEISSYSKMQEVKGVILDGFPRSIEQDALFCEALKEGDCVDSFIFLDVSEENVINRLQSRLQCTLCGDIYNTIYAKPQKEGICDNCGDEISLRFDDSEIELIQTRFKTFKNETMQVINKYSEMGLVLKVDGSLSPRDVFATISPYLREKIKV